MSKFEAELRLPCKQPYAYISMWVRGETVEEFQTNYALLGGLNVVEDLTKLHGHAYDVVMGNKAKPKAEPSAQSLIVSELGGKIIEEASIPDKGGDYGRSDVPPWERPKPAPSNKKSALDDF